MRHLYCWLQPEKALTQWRTYLLAGRLLVTDRTLAPLVPHERFGTDAGAGATRRPLALAGTARPIGHQIGWIGNAWRDVRVWRHDNGFRLRIENIGEFAVAMDGGGVALLEAAPAVGDDGVAQTLLGPPLILALALRGIWCLHASAVAVGGTVTAFAGESGAGKSTLAAYLNEFGGASPRRVADDILPVRLGSAGLLALPHFPQLKVPASEQHPLAAPPEMPLETIYNLDGPAPALGSLPIDSSNALQTIIRHTVAARLFDRELLAQHLRFCADVVGRAAMRRLIYPRRIASLPEVRELIDLDRQARRPDRPTRRRQTCKFPQ